MKELHFLLHDLDCANCAAKIEHKVAKLSGVKEVNVNFATRKMYVELNEEVTDTKKREIVSFIHALEPEVKVVEIKKDNHAGHDHHDVSENDAEHECHHHHEHKHESSCHDACAGHNHHEHEHHHEHHHEAKAERILRNAMKLRVANLDCANCARKVEDAIKKADHIVDASLNFSTSLLFVKVDQEESLDHLQKRLQIIADQVEPGVVLTPYEDVQTDEQTSAHGQRNEVIRLCIALLLFLAGEAISKDGYGFWLLLGALLVSGGPVILNALRNILHGEVFDENFLMSLASVGAFAIGEWGEGTAVMIFYEIGELFQSYAVNRSRRNIADLMNIKADYANKLVDGVEVKVAPSEVHPGDIIVIRPGERVPLDGVITQGTSSLDTSALSGESLPRDVACKDEILAGSVNLSGYIQMEVTKELQESTVSRILELVENAGSKKAPMEKFITKFARVYTPSVVGLALLLLVIPMLVLKDAVFYDWLYRALTFLVVSCPCALVVSIPLGLFAGIGGASRKGILIKGGNYLEALCDIDTVVFDKTGTLTKGTFHVEDINAHDTDRDTLLELGAYGECYSNHPIANSIVQSYGKAIDKRRIRDFEELAGNGIKVKIDGQSYFLGNSKWMRAQNVAYAHDTPIGTIVHIAREKQYLGYIAINDEMKETSAAAISALKAEGVKQCVMLSGDRQEVAQAVAERLGLDQVYAQLLPQDKVAKVEELLAKKTKGKLAFVGDGINDAPVLARADIGVAMGKIGSDAAIEAADVVLMKDDPKALADAIRISKKTKRILWQNIVFSLGVKIAVLILTVFALSSMWMGVFADVGVTVLAIINSMRALKVS